MLLSAKLLISRSRALGSHVDQPLIAARVNGKSTLLIVDTGASETLLARSLVRRLQIREEPTDSGQDHAGADVPTWICNEMVSLEIGTYAVQMARVATIETPAGFECDGIGGILCPQRLHPDATLQLDLRGARMTLVEGPSFGGEFESGLGEDLVPLRLSCKQATGDLASLIIVEGAFETSPRTSLLLNTGTWESEAAPNKSEELMSRPSRRGLGLSGAPVDGTVVSGRFTIGDAIVPVPAIVLRPQPDELGGQLGMGVLGLTRVEVHKPSGVVCWWIPRAWLRHRG